MRGRTFGLASNLQARTKRSKDHLGMEYSSPTHHRRLEDNEWCQGTPITTKVQLGAVMSALYYTFLILLPPLLAHMTSFWFESTCGDCVFYKSHQSSSGREKHLSVIYLVIQFMVHFVNARQRQSVFRAEFSLMRYPYIIKKSKRKPRHLIAPSTSTGVLYRKRSRPLTFIQPQTVREK